MFLRSNFAASTERSDLSDMMMDLLRSWTVKCTATTLGTHKFYVMMSEDSCLSWWGSGVGLASLQGVISDGASAMVPASAAYSFRAIRRTGCAMGAIDIEWWTRVESRCVQY
jgi:hypothetical protein